MRKINRIIHSVAITGLFLMVCGCSSDPQGEVLFTWPEGYDPEVTLCLQVDIADASSPSGSRSTTDPSIEPKASVPSFAYSGSDYEKINTLRVIIVRPDNSIEHNRLIKNDGSPTERMEELKFQVSTSQGFIDTKEETQVEKKRVYLIVNEESIPQEEILNRIKSLTPYTIDEELEESEENESSDSNHYLTAEEAASWIIYPSEWGEGAGEDESLAVPMINNNEATDGKGKFIPMTEFFDINVKADVKTSGSHIVQNEKMFVTRNLVKFQFSAQGDAYHNETYRITEIRFENLMKKEYLIPNNVVYDPPKDYFDPENNKVTRSIISFNYPKDDNPTRPYVFKPENFGHVSKNFTGDNQIIADMKDRYNPLLYFCETQNFVGNANHKPIYKVGITVEIIYPDGSKFPEPIIFEPQELDNLPNSLPRNTIVHVNFKIKNHVLECEAVLLPYTAISLEPDFGIIIKDQTASAKHYNRFSK